MRFDNASVSTYYSGTQVLVKDQAGKERMNQTNGLGQLTDVWEITPSDQWTEGVSFPGHGEVTNGYHTLYEYDALDDLTKVTQGTQPARTFNYDSLKRLTSASNPESGAASYDYDSNGNLMHKVDPRLLADNQTHVMTTYDYDALNRVKTRSYNDGTPTVSYNYDTASNGKGRLASVSSSVSSYSYSGYDAMGRVLSAAQVLGGQTYSMSYSYDLAGHEKTMAYPSGHVVNYFYDSAGRPGDLDALHPAFGGNLGDGTMRTYSSVAGATTYDAASRLRQEKFGTSTAIYNKLFYNVRGQLAEIREGTTANDTWWNRGAIINHYSNNYGCWERVATRRTTTET